MTAIGRPISFYFLPNVSKCSVFEHMHSKLAKFYGDSKFLEIVLIDMRSVRQYLAVVFREKKLKGKLCEFLDFGIWILHFFALFFAYNFFTEQFLNPNPFIWDHHKFLRKFGMRMLKKMEHFQTFWKR
jgi:hypothetical protein